MNSTMNDPNQNSPQHRFMSLGMPTMSRSGIPQTLYYSFQKPIQQQVNIVPGSFIAQPIGRQNGALPDIFTTCPELRSVEVPFVLAAPVQNEFNLPRAVPVATLPPPVWNPNIVTNQIQIPIQFPPAPTQQIPSPHKRTRSFYKFDPNSPIINPQELHFVPPSEWSSKMYSLSDLKLHFFTRRNGVGCVFPVKLYHALLITKQFPDAYCYTGVMWVTKNIMKVNAHIFAHLLGIHAVQGGLFHKQGNFTRHKYVQVMFQNMPELEALPQCSDVDDTSVRLFADPLNRFSRDTEYNFSVDSEFIDDS